VREECFPHLHNSEGKSSCEGATVDVRGEVLGCVGFFV
jgi:hypothetical protein